MASDAQVLDMVLRSCRRSAASVHGSMMQKVSSLATIASVAPFVAIFGTVLGIINSFKGVGMEKSAIRALTFAGLSDALAPSALGLLVAIPAFCFYNYLCHRIEDLDTEMENTALELVNSLSIQLARLR
jgi:biopolymer transport protein ExbB/TolQ